MARNDALRKARLQRHWTQSTLAAQLNTTRMTVIRWEQSRTSPGLYFREQLCQIFHMTEQELGLDEHLPLAPEQPIWQVPEERNRFFTGREGVLQQLDALLRREREAFPSRVLAIRGLAGIGKTQVALEYAYRFRQHYAAVIWLRAETQETLMAESTKLAGVLQLSTGQERPSNAQISRALQSWLESHSNWLLIFDNVEEPELIYRILPSHDLKGHVLITTRMQAMGRSSGQFLLDSMEREEAALLLLRRAKLLPVQAELHETDGEQRRAAEELGQELAGFPLALDQAGAYMEEIGCDPAGYLERLSHRRSALLSWRSRNPGGYPTSVTATVMLAQERIARQSPVAYELLCLCAFLHSGKIPERLIIHGVSQLGPVLQEAVADLLSLDAAFAILNASTLLRRDPETHILTMPRLVQTILRDQLDKKLQVLWIERALRTLEHVFPAPPRHERISWPLCEQLLPHVLSCIEHLKRLGVGPAREQALNISTALLLKSADYLFEQARYQEAEIHLERALLHSRQISRSAYPGKATSLRTLALLYEKLGKYSQADTLIRQVLLMQQRELAANDPQIAHSLKTLALLHGRRGKYVDAEKMVRRALNIYQQANAEESADAAEALNILAQIGIWTGRYQEAVAWSTRALHLLEKSLGEWHPSVATVAHTLAVAFWEQGKYGQAREVFQQAAEIWEHVLGPDHPSTGYPLHNQAMLYKMQGNYSQAEKLFKHVLQLWEETLGAYHPECIEPLKNLGELYLLQERFSEGEQAIQKALQIYQHNPDLDHPHMAVPLSILAALAAEQGQYEQAEELYQQAYALCAQGMDLKHPHMAKALHGHARLCMKQEKYTQASTLFERALAIRVEKLGTHHPDTQLTRTLYQTVRSILQDGDQSANQPSLV